MGKGRFYKYIVAIPKGRTMKKPLSMHNKKKNALEAARKQSNKVVDRRAVVFELSKSKMSYFPTVEYFKGSRGRDHSEPRYHT